MPVISKKICIIGDFGVGKTSLIRYFVDRQFSDQYLSTIGVKISRKILDISEGKTSEFDQIKLLIWDIEGQTRFQAITPTYLQGAAGVIVVGALNRVETIQHLQAHLNLVLSVNPHTTQVIVALNKADLVDSEQVIHTLKESEAFYNHPQVSAMYSTSAKTGRNVDEIFQTMARHILAAVV
jgi:small GTP-binding protein